jgi:hypothetical protein
VIEKKMVAALLANSDVTDLVGDRIFPVVVRSDTDLPAVTYQRTFGERTYSMAGSAGWARVNIAVAGWAREYAQARSIADVVRQTLDAYAGSDADDIQIGRVTDGPDAYDPDLDVFGCSLDVEVQYQEV